MDSMNRPHAGVLTRGTALKIWVTMGLAPRLVPIPVRSTFNGSCHLIICLGTKLTPLYLAAQIMLPPTAQLDVGDSIPSAPVPVVEHDQAPWGAPPSALGSPTAATWDPHQAGSPAPYPMNLNQPETIQRIPMSGEASPYMASAVAFNNAVGAFSSLPI